MLSLLSARLSILSSRSHRAHTVPEVPRFLAEILEITYRALLFDPFMFCSLREVYRVPPALSYGSSYDIFTMVFYITTGSAPRRVTARNIGQCVLRGFHGDVSSVFNRDSCMGK